jgi:hypothetical protein
MHLCAASGWHRVCRFFTDMRQVLFPLGLERDRVRIDLAASVEPPERTAGRGVEDDETALVAVPDEEPPPKPA